VKADRHGRFAPALVRGILLAAAALVAPLAASAGVKVAEQEDFTLELGMRLQPRMELERLSSSAGDWQRDFLVRRARLKANGRMLKATYGFEWKIDGTDQVGASPSAQVENAWVQYPIGRGVEIRAGLYDQPFSRDRLTSDSRQLAVDRGNVSNVPDGFGLADNATGFHVLGKAFKGKAAYAVGLFDNRRIAGRFQDQPMVVGRLDLNLGATSDIYQDAHFGDGKWYSLGFNGSYQPIEDLAGTDSLTNAAFGADAMMDIPTRAGRLFVRGEASTVTVDPSGPGPAIDTRQWMVGVGLLILDQRLQPFVRFDEIRYDALAGGGIVDVTYAGVNLYQKGHSLKLQGDVRMQANTGEALDGVRVQAQLDF
jgi:hypothetical protein